MTRKYRINRALIPPSIFVLPHRSETESQNEPSSTVAVADFETAIKTTGFGKYNLLQLLLAIPAGWSSNFETTTMSYVFPAAHCDLDLSLEDKGLLNAITYLGMILSAPIWGFLYDTLGRKKLLIIGFALDALFVLTSTLAQTKQLLMAMKFMGGFVINGPFAAFPTYLSEFQSSKYRARMQLVSAFILTIATVFLPLLAWGIMPRQLNLEVASLKLHSWNIYLLICSLPSIIGAVSFVFMPESPKFLMTMGQNDKALAVFRRVYSMNTGNGPDTFLIKELVDETKNTTITAARSKVQALNEGWAQMKPLFSAPHLRNLILVCAMQMLFHMSLNSLRLWLPQIFQAMSEYQIRNNGTSSSLCAMLEMIQPVASSGSGCVVNFDASIYTNSMIVAVVTMTSFIAASFFINLIGKKTLTVCLGIVSGTSAMAIYFSTSTAFTLSFASIFIATASVATNVVLTVIIDLVPTSLRTMTVSLALMMARSGAMIGNILFPVLLEAGCAPPFFSVGSVILGCTLLALLLPNTDMKALV